MEVNLSRLFFSDFSHSTGNRPRAKEKYLQHPVPAVDRPVEEVTKTDQYRLLRCLDAQDAD